MGVYTVILSDQEERMLKMLLASGCFRDLGDVLADRLGALGARHSGQVAWSTRLPMMPGDALAGPYNHGKDCGNEEEFADTGL